jgi:hypothetical protein
MPVGEGLLYAHDNPESWWIFPVFFFVSGFYIITIMILIIIIIFLSSLLQRAIRPPLFVSSSGLINFVGVFFGFLFLILSDIPRYPLRPDPVSRVHNGRVPRVVPHTRVPWSTVRRDPET